MPQKHRKCKLDDPDPDDPDLTLMLDRQIFQQRERQLEEALIGGKQQLLCINNVQSKIARGKVVVRDLIPAHVTKIAAIMEDGIVPQLLYFRCFIETGNKVDTKDEEIVKKIVKDIQNGTTMLYFLSGIHRFKALQLVNPDFMATLDIYDAKQLKWSTGQYIATRDNRVSSHKKQPCSY